MAEDLNQRGAMEMAVPFYRQVISLLMGAETGIQPAAVVQAERQSTVISQTVVRDGPLSDALMEPEQTEEDAARMELNRQLAAIIGQLQPHTSAEAEAALAELSERWAQPNDALLAAQAKAALLQGKIEIALEHFEQALELNPHSVQHRLNAASAHLASGRHQMCLALLEPLAAQEAVLRELGILSSFRNNWILAQLADGNVEAANEALAQWLRDEPASVNLATWIEQAKQLIADQHLRQAKQLLSTLAEGANAEQRRMVLPPLAELLDELGEHRDAALLYRELLRQELETTHSMHA
ncbi:hypothetical protein KUL97_01430 [Synechococcus sp. HK05]|uniref:tetratricopeptide repeat protein n=1 Tax=Synechococcus sp. HK05 TaxID=2725975 RepID=UPI001C39516E|nr:hypothetical protein [Synechococcus sp. HK05]MBV2350363.1 hypothetical protein [Synechococcus sp. HK05]